MFRWRHLSTQEPFLNAFRPDQSVPARKAVSDERDVVLEKRRTLDLGVHQEEQVERWAHDQAGLSVEGNLPGCESAGLFRKCSRIVIIAIF